MRLPSPLHFLITHLLMLKQCITLMQISGDRLPLKNWKLIRSMGLGNLWKNLSGAKVIGSKWVFKLKCNTHDSIEHYKARLVTKCYDQRSGFDYLEIFVPIVCLSSIRVIPALTAIQDLHLYSIDVSHAYFNRDMDCEVYMTQLEYFTEEDPRKTSLSLGESYLWQQARQE